MFWSEFLYSWVFFCEILSYWVIDAFVFYSCYSDLGLGVWQGSSVAWLCNICRWRQPAPVEGAAGRKRAPRTYKKSRKKKSISQKLRIAQEKSFLQKMSARWIAIYLANLSTFEESWIYGTAFKRVWASVGPERDMIWNFTPIYFFSTLRIFYVDRATAGGGLHIRSWETTRPQTIHPRTIQRTNYNYQTNIKNLYIK